MIAPNLPSLFMRNVHKLKETAAVDEEGNPKDCFVLETLKKYNIHNIFNQLFLEHNDTRRVAHIKVAFVILAYSYNSTWIDIDKDRYINKKEIISTLIADSEISLDEETINKILSNQDMVLLDCINYYIESQKDSDFAAMFSLIEHISFCNRMAMRTTDITDKNLNDRTRYLSDIENCQARIQVIRSRIESKYMNLDEAMKKEGRTPISKDIDLTILENRLALRMGIYT